MVYFFASNGIRFPVRAVLSDSFSPLQSRFLRPSRSTIAIFSSTSPSLLFPILLPFARFITAGAECSFAWQHSIRDTIKPVEASLCEIRHVARLTRPRVYVRVKREIHVPTTVVVPAGVHFRSGSRLKNVPTRNVYARYKGTFILIISSFRLLNHGRLVQAVKYNVTQFSTLRVSRKNKVSSIYAILLS